MGPEMSFLEALQHSPDTCRVLSPADHGLGSPLAPISEAEALEDSRCTDKSLALWPLQP
jgi:hypothetical protein